MFDSLSKREKFLAGIVGGILPLAGLFMVFIWFLDSYSGNEDKIVQLHSQIGDQMDKRDARDRATQRKKYYQSISFPSDASKADADYQFWLQNIDPKMPIQLRSVRGGVTKFGTDEVFQQRGYKITTRGTLDQITNFLYTFHSLPMLHRINKITISPRNAGAAGTSSKIRTGEHNISIGIDVITLKDADKDRDFMNAELTGLKKSLDEYNEKIVFRNIFGPANNTPTVDASPSSTYYPDTEIAFRVTGNDADKADKLNFELIDCPIPDAELSVDTENRSARFKAPAMTLGDYEFKIKVSDNGYPPKSSIETVKLAVVKRPNSEPSISLSSTALKVEAGTPIDIEFSGSDRDEDDKLDFKLASSEIEGLKLESLEGRKGKLIGPALDEGEYKFELAVTDSAAEPVTKTKEFTLSILPPKFLIASKTQITGILGSSKGAMVWVSVRPTGEFHKLRKGESFTVDRKEWVVHRIDVDKLQVWLQHDGYLKMYEPDDFLTSPRKKEKMTTPVVVKD